MYLTYIFYQAGMMQQLSKFFIYNLTVKSYLYVYDTFRIVDLDPFNIWVWVAGFFFTDLAYYFFHRAAHEVNLFWATHVVSYQLKHINDFFFCSYQIFFKKRFITLLNIIINLLHYVKVFSNPIVLGFLTCLLHCLFHPLFTLFTNNSILYFNFGKKKCVYDF